MPARRLPVPPQLRSGPFLASAAIAAGLVSESTLHGPSYRRIFRGVHVVAETPDSTAVRAAAAGLVLPRSAVASHATAAFLHGVDIARPGAPIEAIAVPPRTVRCRDGLLVRESRLDCDEVVDVMGLSVTSVPRTCVDLACSRDLVEAVVALDALLGTGLLTFDELASYALRHRGRRNIHRLRRAMALANPRAESPMETRLRLLLVLAGFPEPVVQHEVWHAGRLLGRLDLAYPDLLLGIEFDGTLHELAPRSAADIRRGNGLLEIGWRLLRYDASDYYRRPRLVLGQVASAMSLAA